MFTYKRNNVLIGEFVVCLRRARRYNTTRHARPPRPDFHQDTCDIRRELQYRVSGATEHILLLPVTFMEQYEKPCDTLPKRSSSLTNIEKNIYIIHRSPSMLSSLIWTLVLKHRCGFNCEFQLLYHVIFLYLLWVLKGLQSYYSEAKLCSFKRLLILISPTYIWNNI